MSKHPNRTVDVRGIFNHKITSAPLAIAGSVILSTSGEAIVTMYQNAYYGKKSFFSTDRSLQE